MLLDEVFVGIDPSHRGQLLTDDIDKAVTTARFIWTGTALEQADLPEPIASPVSAGTLFDSP